MKTYLTYMQKTTFFCLHFYFIMTSRILALLDQGQNPNMRHFNSNDSFIHHLRLRCVIYIPFYHVANIMVQDTTVA